MAKLNQTPSKAQLEPGKFRIRLSLHETYGTAYVQRSRGCMTGTPCRDASFLGAFIYAMI